MLASLFTTSCKEVLGSLDNPVSSYLELKQNSAKLEPGATCQIEASTISTMPIKYESANPAVATVDANGKVTAVADGETIIKVSVAANDNYLAGVAEFKVWTCDPDMFEPLTLIAKNNGWVYINFVNYNTAASTLAEPINYTINSGAVQSASPSVSTNNWEYVPISVNANDTIRFTSKNAKLAGRFYNSEGGYYMDQYVRIYPNVECAAYGNVMSLITPDGNFYKNRSIKKSAALAYLFNTWSNYLVNHETRNITLPATEVADSCYLNMFSGCYGLKSAPVLPAKEVGVSSYQWMFNNCPSLEAAPELPATTLGDYCYYAMFYNCDALTEAPVLPATEMKDYCYAWMFENCDGLKSAPVLPSTTLANRCYNGMFARCRSLESAPALPATKLADGCYANMFNNCTSLKTAPALPATELKDGCYNGMFSVCESLAEAPELKAESLPAQCYMYMFQNCYKLSKVTCMAKEMTGYNAISYMLAGAGTDASVTERTFTRSTANDKWAASCDTWDWIWDVDDWRIPTGWTIDPAITAASAPARRAAAVKGTPIKTPTSIMSDGGEDTGGVKAPAKTNI